MKEDIKYSLFFGILFTVLLGIAFYTYGEEEILNPLFLGGIFLLMTLACFLVTRLVGRKVSGQLRELDEKLEEEENERDQN